MVQYLSNNDHMLSDTKPNPIELLLQFGFKCWLQPWNGNCKNKTVSALSSKVLDRIELEKTYIPVKYG